MAKVAKIRGFACRSGFANLGFARGLRTIRYKEEKKNKIITFWTLKVAIKDSPFTLDALPIKKNTWFGDLPIENSEFSIAV